MTVVPVKTRLKRLGNNFRSPLMEAVHQDDLTGVEFGTIIKIKKRTWLEEVRINVLSCSYDDLTFRLNIYGRDEMGRFVNILRQPIYASIPRTDDPTTVTINLADLHIVTDDDLIVAYQHISSSLTGQIRFPIGLTAPGAASDTTRAMRGRIQSGRSAFPSASLHGWNGKRSGNTVNPLTI